MRSLNRLQQRYPHLRVWERIPLLLAAQNRGDEPETDRLRRSSPPYTWTFGEHTIAELSLHILATIFVTEQLDAACALFFFAWHWGEEDGPPEEQEFVLACCNHAYVVNAEAWRRFCEELGVDPIKLVESNYRGMMLTLINAGMMKNAPSKEELAARFSASGKELKNPATVESRMASWREALHQMCLRHPPPEKK